MREYVSNLVVILSIVFTMPGCSQKQKRIIRAAAPSRQAAFSFEDLETNIDIDAQKIYASDPDLEMAARLYDVPSMVGSIPLQLKNTSIEAEGQSVHGILSPYDENEVTNFYMLEMENFGWQRVACIKGPENTLLFQKPKKICIVSIRSRNTKANYKSLIYVSVGKKEKINQEIAG